MKDILLDEEADLLVENGDLSLGESFMQEVGCILKLNQGDLKSDPILGPNLVRLINSSVSEDELQSIVKTNLARDNKDYDEVKKIMIINREKQ